jgi:hypothetical protein
MIMGGSVCSGREGHNPTGESPAMSIVRFGHVAMPRFVWGNPTFIAWCKRPDCPMRHSTLEAGATFGASKYGSLNIKK